MQLNGRWRIFAALALALGAGAVVAIWGWTTRGGEAEPASEEAGLPQLVDALRDGDIDLVVSRLDFKAMPCGVPFKVREGEAIPGPECRGDESQGTTVAVFPVASCDVRFVRSGEAPALVRASLAKFELYAGVKLRHPIGHSPHAILQEGFYGVVGKAGEGRPGLMVSVSFNGAIVNLWPGCGEFASGLMDDRFSEAVLFGPYR